MNENEIKLLPVKEFRQRGYLHEVNRLLLHPLGLAMSVERAEAGGREISLVESDVQEILEELRSVQRMLSQSDILEKLINTIEGAAVRAAGSERLGSIWAYREDAEGIYFGEDLLDADKAASVCAELLERRSARVAALGYVVQPVPGRALTVNYLDPDHLKGSTVTPDVEFEQ